MMHDNSMPVILYGAGYPDTVKLIARMTQRFPGLHVHGYIDDMSKEQTCMGFPILGTRDIFSQINVKDYVFVNNVFSTTAARKHVSIVLETHQCNLFSLIDPDIDTSFVEIGEGVVMMKGVQLGSRVKIGKYCAIRMNAVVNHDNTLGENVFIGPGTVLCGHVTIGDNAYIGAGSVVKEHVRIGDNAIVGAGSVVIQDVEKNAKVAGVPARSIADM